VCRITHQKGLDLLIEIGDEIALLPAQLALLGTGDKSLEAALLKPGAAPSREIFGMDRIRRRPGASAGGRGGHLSNALAL
jgi:hypothetical protein